MSRPWRVLTVRGRTFVVLGIATVVVCMAIGHKDVARVGLLLLLLPLVAGLLVARTRLRLSCERSVVPPQVPVGTPLEGRILLGQEGVLPAGVILLEDDVPPQLGNRPRFVVDRAEMHWRREIRYPLSGMVRGRFTTGPLIVRTTDPFGLVRLDRRFTARTEVLVTPRIVPLGAMRGIGGGGATGEARPHRVGVVGQDDVLVREYRQGDDVRRIHWPSTAKRGELMVRREEQAWDPSAAILIDSRITAHAGEGRTGSFEWAVCAAASIASRLLDDGFRVELYDADGSLCLLQGAADHADAGRQAMLRSLTDVSLRRLSSLHYAVSALRRENAGQLIIAITGRLSAHDATQLAQLRRPRSQALALLLDVDTFVRSGPPPAEETRPDLPAARVLGEAGWRVQAVPRWLPVSTAWERLARTTARPAAV